MPFWERDCEAGGVGVGPKAPNAAGTLGAQSDGAFLMSSGNRYREGGYQRVSLVLVYAQVGAQPYCYGLHPTIGLSEFIQPLHEAILP